MSEPSPSAAPLLGRLLDLLADDAPAEELGAVTSEARAMRRARGRPGRGGAGGRHRPADQGRPAPAPAQGTPAHRPLRHGGRPGGLPGPGRRAEGDRAAGQDAARHRHRLSHAPRRGGRGHLHAGDRRIGVRPLPAAAARTGRGARRSRGPDRQPVRDPRLPHRRPLPPHPQHQRRCAGRGARRDPRRPPAARLQPGRHGKGHRGPLRRRPRRPGLQPRRGGPALLARRARRDRHRHRPRPGRHPHRPRGTHAAPTRSWPRPTPPYARTRPPCSAPRRPTTG